MSGLKKFIRTSSLLLGKNAPTPSIAIDTLTEKKKFEVILVSWDEKKEDFLSYYEKMPWLALPFEDKEAAEFLTKGFSVESIPTLIGVEADSGKIVTTTARTRLVQDPEGKQFPWSS